MGKASSMATLVAKEYFRIGGSTPKGCKPQSLKAKGFRSPEGRNLSTVVAVGNQRHKALELMKSLKDFINSPAPGDEVSLQADLMQFPEYREEIEQQLAAIASWQKEVSQAKARLYTLTEVWGM